jgi:putative ABC transport system ATP-binding protein
MMSVGENVAFGLARRGVPRAERVRKSAAMLERVGLGGAEHKRVDELSGGQRQRVAIARALVGSPAIVLADEPTGHLDQATGRAIVGLFQDLHDRGVTIVVVTHDRDIAARMGRRIEMLDGQIVFDSAAETSPTRGFTSGDAARRDPRR